MCSETFSELYKLRHSMAHVLAQAVKRLHGDTVQVTIGPVTNDGFYYDFKLEKPFTPDDLPPIEKEMKRIVKANYPIVRKEIGRQEAIDFFTQLGEDYKVRIINDLPEDELLTLYEQEEFIDLCRGPHAPSTGHKKPVFKLTDISAAYWRGDAKTGDSLCRVYGTAFFTKEELQTHLNQKEEAKKRDHRVLGPSLDLFSIHSESPGQILWHPKGLILRNLLIDLLRHQLTEGEYQEIETPQILSDALWKKSGHYEKFRENMFFCDLPEESHVQYGLKPMNCPGAAIFYKTKRRSYRELPLRVSEFGRVFRYEPSGVLHGLLRVRGFMQDDAHVFCRMGQIEQEVKVLIDFVKRLYKAFDFSEPAFSLGTCPEKHIGEPAKWREAEQALQKVLDDAGATYEVGEGDGAFYGPKIDFNVKDAIGRTWQCGTIQLDFFLPERFNCTAINEEGHAEPVILIHRAIMGSLERFIGICIENYAGKFPAWLAPTQVKVVPITDECIEYAQETIVPALKAKGIRFECDFRNEKIGYKIRENQVHKVPYLIIVGKNEIASDTVSIRDYNGNQQSDVHLSEFIKINQWSVIDHFCGG